MRKKAFLKIWIITAKDRTINSADCLGCKAGLTESCSLIASVLFYLEAWTKVNVNLSCTQIKCPLILPSSANKVEYSRVRDIYFKSAKKMKADLDETIENLNGSLVSLGGNFKIGLKAFRKNHISDDLDFGSEANLDRNDPTV